MNSGTVKYQEIVKEMMRSIKDYCSKAGQLLDSGVMILKGIQKSCKGN